MLLLLVACGEGKIALQGGDTDDTGAVEDVGGVDSAEETGADSTGETAGETAEDTGEEPWPRACSELYDPDTLQTFDLSFTDEDLGALRRDCNQGAQSYHPATFTWNGESVDAQVRLKGNWSWSCDKLQFVVSFNEEDADARFHGQRKLVLDAPWYDRTFLHERMAFPLFEARGLPYSCVNNARVTINGDFYGLYANVERVDHEYLERHFDESDGNLYQGGTELKTNEDEADTGDLLALQAAVTVDEYAALIDLDQAVAEWATEAMLPAMDNYWAGVEINYYLYSHPSRGFVYVPYDLDISFGDAAYTDGTLVWPDAVYADPLTYEHSGWQKEALVETVLADDHWCGRFVEELVLTRDAFDADEMATRLDAWSAQIEDAVAEDGRKPFSDADHARAVAALREFLYDRASIVDGWLAEGDHCPVRW